MAEQLKHVYNEAYVSTLAEAIRSEYPAFRVNEFIAAVFFEKWDELELKQRMRHITVCLRDALPKDYRKAVTILSRAIPHLKGYGLENLIFPDYVEQYGLEDWDISLPALALFTCYGTSEFAVRPFIVKDAERMMAQMALWAESDVADIRRLASEGCRPRLPWAMALPAFKKDPSPVLPILEKLKTDESEYVRRSVANNLNDIAKDHPGLVLEVGRRWLSAGDARTDWIVKHGCRTLLKKGIPEALALFGFETEHPIEVRDVTIAPNPVRIGDSAIISFILTPGGDTDQRLRIEYGIDFVKANGLRNRKLFKITENTYKPNRPVTFTRRHSFREMTTRKHYPGVHAVSVIVNGVELAKVDFDLLSSMSFS